jgi:hypothetical protein
MTRRTPLIVGDTVRITPNPPGFSRLIGVVGTVEMYFRKPRWYTVRVSSGELVMLKRKEIEFLRRDVT